MRAAALVLAAVTLPVCAEPPTKELDMAAERVAAAEASEAALFSPEALADAKMALQQARNLSEEDRRYPDAIRLAGESVARADAAFVEAVTEKRVVSRRLERAFSELEGLIAIAESRGATEEEVLPFGERLRGLKSTAERGDLLAALDGAVALEPELLAFEQGFRRRARR